MYNDLQTNRNNFNLAESYKKYQNVFRSLTVAESAYYQTVLSQKKVMQRKFGRP